ncbi:MAG: tetratricopeptide repeat protein, partial [Spirochaetales bacterium]|nr:tetratricopeptide repeat protein [Spirochaetales bacterium]
LALLFFSCAGGPEGDVLRADYFNLARDLQDAGRYERAEYYYKLALRGDGERGDSLFNLSLLYLETDRTDMALDCLNELYGRDRENLIVMDNLGVVYSRREEWDQALDWYKKVLEIFPWDRTALYNGALIYTRKEMPHESLAWLEKLRERDKGYKTAMALWERSDEKSWQEKLLCLEETETETESEKLDISRKKLDLYRDNGMDREALALLAVLKESDPDRAGEYLFSEGELLLLANRSEEGLRALREAFRKGYKDEGRLSALKVQFSPSLQENINQLVALYFPED